MRRVLTIPALAVVLIAGLAAAAVGLGLAQIPQIPPRGPIVDSHTSHGRTPPPEFMSPTSQGPLPTHLACTAPAQALTFPNYWAGASFDGLTVSGVVRTCDTPQSEERVRDNSVTYLYGDCTPGDDEGCAPPIKIQTWSSGAKQGFAHGSRSP